MKSKILSLSILVLFGAGCAKIDVTPKAGAPSIPSFFNHINGGEVVSGATVGERTLLNRYIVDSAAGIQYSNLTVKTPNGYRVYYGVKGGAISK